MIRFCCSLAFLLALCPLHSRAQFQIHEHDAGDYQPYVDVVFSYTTDELNSYFNLSEPIYLTVEQCGQANAFAVRHPDDGSLAIVICSELLDAITADLRSSGTDEQAIALTFLSQIMYVTFHEVAHILIDTFELPITGREEDAADQFASLLFSEDPILSLLATSFWSMMFGQPGQYGTAEYAGTHGLGEQRYYNNLCWIYGVDPQTRSYVVQTYELPLQRAAACEREFDQLSSSWTRILEPYLTESGKAAFSLEVIRDLSGYWRFVESMSDPDQVNRCSASGTFVLVDVAGELGGQVEQTGTCVLSGIPYSNDAATVIESGSVDADVITFHVEGCTYRGTFDDTTKLSMSGTIECISDLDEGASLELKGKWTAVR